MMKTKRARIEISGNTVINSELPVICPYCSAYIHPTQAGTIAHNYNNGLLIFLKLSVTCCNKNFLAVYETEAKYENPKLVIIYPSPTSEKIPESISTISPRFAELFRQASVAESMGFIELAGSGYRNALEVLIKDYAIDQLGKSTEEVRNKKLYTAIGEYVPSVAVAADVVRILGNDYTHYERKYDEIEFDYLKRYLHIFISTLENEYLMRNPIIPTNRS